MQAVRIRRLFIHVQEAQRHKLSVIMSCHKPAGLGDCPIVNYQKPDDDKLAYQARMICSRT